MKKILQFITVLIFCLLLTHEGFSDETKEKYSIKTMTPEVETALNNRLQGSVSKKVLHDAPCPLLAVPNT